MKECLLCNETPCDLDEISNETIFYLFKLCKSHEKQIKERKVNTDFPSPKNAFLKASMFQDQEIPLTYKGWDKKSNEDRTIGGVLKSWKANLKYMLRYSYPEFAIDEAGEQKLDKEGKPWRNKYYDKDFPRGYSIVFHFEEGDLESGSLPLFEAFCMVKPRPGEMLTIKRTGIDKETKWFVKKVTSKEGADPDGLPTVQLEDEATF